MSPGTSLMPAGEDGLVWRFLWRPPARLIARMPGGASVSPGLITFLTLVLAAIASTLAAAGWYVAAGLAIVAMGVSTGLPAELAGLRRARGRFEVVAEAVGARYAEAALLGGMTLYAIRFEDFTRPEVAGVFALGGVLAASYSRARIEASLGAATDAPAFPGSTLDLRLLAAAAGTAMGQCYWTLIVLGVLAWASVAWRLIYLRAKGIGGVVRAQD